LNRFNLARSIGSFAKKPYKPHPVLDEKNSYVGYYEIDDIMSFSPDSILERTRKNNKGKKVLDYSMSQITQIVESNNGKLLGLFIESDVTVLVVTEN
jgi:Mg/Co/Ni transporter MgtE